MYIFVAVQERADYYRNGPAALTKVRIEAAAGERCLIVPYQEFNLRAVRDLNPRAVVIGGFGQHFQSRKVEWFLGVDEVMHHADVPMLCICGSHQLLGFSFNRDLRRVKLLKDQPIRRLRPGEDRPRRGRGQPEYDLSPFFVADGFFPIRRLKSDPLFAGLPPTLMMRCSHYCEVKRLPPGFEILAASGHSRIEAMRHRTRPLYGTQFHPERFEAPFFHGRRLLENFARITERHWRDKTS